MFLSHPPGCLLSLFILFSVFALLSSIAPVCCACFRAPVFLFIVVRCLSDCRLALLSLSSRCPAHSCLSLFTWSLSISLYAYLASSLRPSSLLSLLPLSWGFFFFSFFAVGSGMFVFSLPSAPLSSLRWLCPAQVLGFRLCLLVLLCLRIFWVLFSLFWCFCLGVLFFLPVGLLCMGFWCPYSLVGCSDVSLPPVYVLFGSWLCLFFFVFFFFPPSLLFFM